MHTLSSLLMWRSMAMTSICLGMALSTKALSRPDSSSSCSRVCTALARGPNAVVLKLWHQVPVHTQAFISISLIGCTDKVLTQASC